MGGVAKLIFSTADTFVRGERKSVTEKRGVVSLKKLKFFAAVIHPSPLEIVILSVWLVSNTWGLHLKIWKVCLVPGRMPQAFCHF